MDTAAFARDGYVVVRDCFDGKELDELRAAVSSILGGPDTPDILRSQDGSVVRKIAYVFDKHPLFLQTLTHPAIIEIATALSPAPDELVVTWEDLLVKAARIGIEVPVHQDLALQSPGGGVFSLGIHFDDAIENPVWFLPGSNHLGKLTRDEIRKLKQERKAEFVAARSRAGDIDVQDVMTAHFSEGNSAATPRHTWYLEFRTAGQLLRNGPWDEEWIRRRQALLVRSAEIRRDRGLPWALPALRDMDRILPYVRDLHLRVPHVGGDVQYDTTSSYYHFD